MQNTHAADLNSFKDEKQKLRRLNLLKKAGLFQSLPAPLKIKRATSIEELRGAYGVVHDAYVEKKYMLPNKGKIRIRPFETSLETGTFISTCREQIVGVTSTVFDSEDFKLPSDKVFGPELDLMREQGCTLCEFSNLAIIPAHRNTSVVSELMRAAWGHGWFQESTDFICAVSPKQVKFFKLMGFEQVGDIRSNSAVVFDPVVLLRVRNVQTRYSPGQPGSPTINDFWNRFYILENPFIPVFPLWDRMIETVFQDPHNVVAFLAGCIELFENASIEERWGIEKRLGDVIDELEVASLSASGLL